MKLQSICPSVILENVQSDYKASARVEQYRVGKQAIYFPYLLSVKYLPFQAVRQAWIQPSSLRLTGSCGRELPIVALRMRCEGDFYQNLTFEKQRNAQRVLSLLAECCPKVSLESERQNSCCIH